MYQVEHDFLLNHGRTSQVGQLRQLGKDVLLLTKPLAKFLHYQKTVSAILGTKEKE
ncbi:hypothetical protein [Legionella qingyii]|uniref:hypothetical protein n=1 Tax=Legionella qingyii TaxID=2184757 RepID=UPI00131581E4|nr:hypothetical protein [Legionella qingyii]